MILALDNEAIKAGACGIHSAILESTANDKRSRTNITDISCRYPSFSKYNRGSIIDVALNPTVRQEAEREGRE